MASRLRRRRRGAPTSAARSARSANPVHRPRQGRSCLSHDPDCTGPAIGRHGVLFAGRAPVDALNPTGFPVAEVGDGSTLTYAFLRANGPGLPFVVGERSEEETWRMAVAGYAEHSRSALGDLLRLAGVWRPDVLVHATMHAAAPLVAAQLRIPTVVHNFGVAAALPIVERMAAVLADEYQARRVTGPPGRIVRDVVPA
ncbi:hypothetical protein ACIO93_33960 [Streptomyces sp. NPDC087903]|uniref:hypothetical protein n=1 Tax=Streptomyces sp. NPDC087903 TaxID=3365819 RepID=UPI003811A977